MCEIIFYKLKGGQKTVRLNCEAAHSMWSRD